MKSILEPCVQPELPHLLVDGPRTEGRGEPAAGTLHPQWNDVLSWNRNSIDCSLVTARKRSNSNLRGGFYFHCILISFHLSARELSPRAGFSGGFLG